MTKAHLLSSFWRKFLEESICRGGTVFWMGFYADISWESSCNIEINVWTHFCKILLDVPYQTRVKGMPGKS